MVTGRLWFEWPLSGIESDCIIRVRNGDLRERRSVTNTAVGRTSPYSWWQSQLKGSGALVADAEAGATTVTLDNVANYHVGGTINVDTGNGGDNLESRTITAIGTAQVEFTPGLSKPHLAGATVTGSGNNLAATDPSAGAAVTPRLIARLEISYDIREATGPPGVYRCGLAETAVRSDSCFLRLSRPPCGGSRVGCWKWSPVWCCLP